MPGPAQSSSFGSPNFPKSDSLSVRAPRGFSATSSKIEFEDGYAVEGDINGKSAIFFSDYQEKNEWSGMVLAQSGCIFSGWEDADELNNPDAHVIAMGYEFGDQIDNAPVREVGIHNGNVVVDDALWAIPGISNCGQNTLSQFAENSAADEDGAYDWENSGEWVTNSHESTAVRYAPAAVLRDYMNTEGGKRYVERMNLRQLNDSDILGHSPYAQTL